MANGSTEIYFVLALQTLLFCNGISVHTFLDLSACYRVMWLVSCPAHLSFFISRKRQISISSKWETGADSNQQPSPWQTSVLITSPLKCPSAPGHTELNLSVLSTHYNTVVFLHFPFMMVFISVLCLLIWLKYEYFKNLFLMFFFISFFIFI